LPWPDRHTVGSWLVVQAPTTFEEINMRVLVAGSTGVLGRQVVPVLRAAGHDVIGLATRRTDSAEPTVIANAFDKDGLVDAVVQAKHDLPDGARGADQLPLTACR
jgi:NAD(P)-dependent dehydrogenase (short-subunit alcohol dehydrogenase family)